jgi:hypothetical protein
MVSVQVFNVTGKDKVSCYTFANMKKEYIIEGATKDINNPAGLYTITVY